MLLLFSSSCALTLSIASSSVRLSAVPHSCRRRRVVVFGRRSSAKYSRSPDVEVAGVVGIFIILLLLCCCIDGDADGDLALGRHGGAARFHLYKGWNHHFS